MQGLSYGAILMAYNIETGSRGMYRLRFRFRFRYFHQILLAVVISALVTLSAEADAPPGEDGVISCSNNNKYCVRYDKIRKETVICSNHKKNVNILLRRLNI
jgi:hypothetical protein